MKRRGPRTKWQRIIRETVLEILIGAAIGLAFDAMLFIWLVVKVTPEAYNALVEIYNESTLSLKQIASLLIVKAAEQVVYDKE